MSCKLEGCNQHNYHYNPLITPLLNFHKSAATLGKQLPKKGNAAEVAKRIGYAVVSPFAYIALSFVALAGLILNGIWKKRHVSVSLATNQKGLDLLAMNSGKTTEPTKTSSTEHLAKRSGKMPFLLPSRKSRRCLSIFKRSWSKKIPMS